MTVLKYYGINKGIRIISIWLIITFLMFIPAYAESNDCEKLAKEYQRAYGGDLILVQPLKPNGAYDLGDYNGHWINKAWNKELGTYYHDASIGDYYISDKSQIKKLFEDDWNKEVIILNYNQGEISFDIIWHY